MRLAEVGLIASTLQLCVARHAHAHAHAHIPRHKHTQVCALSPEVGCTPEAAFTRTTTSLLFVEADVDIQYQDMMSAARQSTETSLGKQYPTGLQSTKVGPHYYTQAVPSQGWMERNRANSTWRFGNHSSTIYQHTSHTSATPLPHSFPKPLIATAGAGGTPGDQSFSSSGLHGKQRASRFAVLIIILIVTGAALFVWS